MASDTPRENARVGELDGQRLGGTKTGNPPKVPVRDKNLMGSDLRRCRGCHCPTCALHDFRDLTVGRDRTRVGHLERVVWVANPTVILYVCNKQQSLGIRFILSIAGYYVLTASTANSALRALRRYPIDLVLAQQSIAGDIGDGLLHRIKSLKPDVPVALLVPSSKNRQPQNGAADMLLARDVDPPRFLAAVAQALSGSLVGREV